MQVPQTVSAWILAHFTNEIVLLIVINVFLLIVGMVTVSYTHLKTDCKATLYDLDDKEKLREEMADSYIFVNGTGVGMKPLELSLIHI